MGCGISDFLKFVGQGGFGAHSEAKLVTQFLPTKFLCHKMSQNSIVFSFHIPGTLCPILNKFVFWDPLKRLNKIYIDQDGQKKKF